MHIIFTFLVIMCSKFERNNHSLLSVNTAHHSHGICVCTHLQRRHANTKVPAICALCANTVSLFDGSSGCHSAYCPSAFPTHAAFRPVT